MSVDRPGFADPVLDAQACFRVVLSAMAEPGRIFAAGAGVSAPPPLDPATAAVLLTLVDAETPFWLDPAASSALPWIAFHCGAPQVAAQAALFGLTMGWRDLGAFAAGTHDAPELGATLIVQLPALGCGRLWHLEGPGLNGKSTLAAEGLPEDFAASWAANAGRYPRGIDLVLCAGRSVAALPRTVRVA